jgi:uncharacterized protein
MTTSLRIISYVALCISTAMAQDNPSTQASSHSAQETAKLSSRSASEIAQIQAKAAAGEARAQTTLGEAFRVGDGVLKNDEMAAKWFRKAAEQDDATAENDLGIMYFTGKGVALDKEEAVRWYSKAAKHGSAEAMFNLGASYYNGEGVTSNGYTAYAWFLLAQDAGDKVADDAVQRSAATLSLQEKANTFFQIASMYEKGEELPHNEEKVLRWMRMAAPINPQAKVRLAVYLLQEPDPARFYGEVLDLCKAAAKDNYPSGLHCVGYMYRKGWGVTQDSAQAMRWYVKAAAFGSPLALMELAEMDLAGEGTKVDRPAAFLLLFRASGIGIKGAKHKASELLPQLSKTELKQVEKKLRDQRLDPKKVFALIKETPSS